jgi:Flp pilus assembly protein TadD
MGWIIALWAGSLAPAADLLEEAAQHYRQGRPAEAVRLYREYLARNPDRADVRVFLGAALLNLEAFDQASAEAQRALKLDPGFAKAHTLNGRIYTARGDWRAAQEAFSRAIALEPLDRETWYFSGRAFYEENRFEQAVAALERALELGATQSRTYEVLGLSYEMAGDARKAESAFRNAVKLAGGAGHPYLSFGRFLLRQSRVTESVSMLEEAARRTPADPECHLELARAFLRLERLDEAAQAARRSLSLKEDRRPRLQLVRVYMLQGRPQEAQEEAERAAGCGKNPEVTGAR